MKALLIFAALLALAVPAAAQVRPQPGSGDPRLQTVDYDAAQIVQLQGAPGYQLTVQLSPDEQVQSVAVGDSGAWTVTVNGARDHLFVKPLQADAATNMTVITTVRVYNFELLALPMPAPDMAWNVRFRYPVPQPPAADPDIVDVSAVLRRASRYRISGDRLLRPSSVTNDNRLTYIRWAAAQPIPAVYALAANGEEILVNGGMRGDDYVIEGVAGRLVFRIDRRAAHADRIAAKRNR
ncbi:MAG: TrbG/VirB9 family P-type conjugative transfer protein [Sphingomicrobium sp.]